MDELLELLQCFRRIKTITAYRELPCIGQCQLVDAGCHLLIEEIGGISTRIHSTTISDKTPT